MGVRVGDYVCAIEGTDLAGLNASEIRFLAKKTETPFSITLGWLETADESGEIDSARDEEESGGGGERREDGGGPAAAEVDGGTFRPQQGEPTYAAKLDRSSGEVHWHEPALILDRRIRAMSPWPGGWVAWDKGPLKILAAHPVAAEETAPPGTILATSPELVIATGDGALALDQVRAPGRKAVSGADFANGARLAPHDPLAPPE